MPKNASVAEEWPVLLRMDISHLGYPVKIGGSVDTDVALHEQSIQPWEVESHAYAGSR